MKNKFPQYFMGDETVVNELLKNGIVVLDTNALLNLYRFNENDQKKFLEILLKIKDRLWMPYNVGEEFFRNRSNVIFEKMSLKENLKEAFKKLNKNQIDVVENSGNHKLGHLKHEDKVKKELRDAIDEFDEKVKHIIDESDFYCLNSIKISEDTVVNELIKLYDDKVGINFDDDRLNELYEEGKTRYQNNIPPGYKDKNKSENKCYGDFLIWTEMIDYSNEKSSNILFVSDDTKEDWCTNENGVRSLRIDLIKEFLKRTENKSFYSITTRRLVDLATKVFEITDVDDLKDSLGRFNQSREELDKNMGILDQTSRLSELVKNMGILDQTSRLSELDKNMGILDQTSRLSELDKNMGILDQTSRFSELDKNMGILDQTSRLSELVKNMGILDQTSRLSELDKNMGILDQTSRLSELDKNMGILDQTSRLSELDKNMGVLDQTSRLSELDKNMGVLDQTSRLSELVKNMGILDQTSRLSELDKNMGILDQTSGLSELVKNMGILDQTSRLSELVKNMGILDQTSRFSELSKKQNDKDEK